MRKYLIILYLIAVTCACRQVRLSESIIIDNKKICCDSAIFFTRISAEMPSFPGGQKALINYLNQNKIQCNNSGTVITSFIIDIDGSIKCARIVEGISKECDNEVLRLIQSMPKWNIGQTGGKPVLVWYHLPVKI